MDDENIEIRAKEAEFWWNLEVNSLLYAKEYGSQTIKSLITINGAAIIATLSFVASVISKGSELNINFDFISCAIISFSFGVILSVISAGIGYLNFSMLNGSLPGPHGLHKYIRDADISGFGDSDKNLKWTARCAVLLTILSGIGFVIGVAFSFWVLKGIVI